MLRRARQPAVRGLQRLQGRAIVSFPQNAPQPADRSSGGPAPRVRSVQPVNRRPIPMKDRVLIPGRVTANFGSRLQVEDKQGVRGLDAI